MIGPIDIRVRNSRNTYTFTLKRNITILCGDSGTGKTTLFNMVDDYYREGDQSGVSVSCNRPVIALGRKSWEENLAKNQNSVIIIDEDNSFIRSAEFARAVKNSSNYYLIITRAYLHNLPYSVEEIYEITGQKNKKFKKAYTEINQIYDSPTDKMLPFKPQVIITEDSNSGFQFFREIAKQNGIECISAGGKSNIVKLVNNYPNKDVVVIADGAAFGSDMYSMVLKQKMSKNRIALFLPESFEWLILSSGRVCNSKMEKIAIPGEYIDSAIHISWERYFTDLLIEETEGKEYMKYSKEKLRRFYLQEDSIKAIKNVIKGLNLN